MLRREGPDGLEEPRRGWVGALHLHEDDADGVVLHDLSEPLEIIEAKGNRTAPERAGHPVWLESGEEVAIERVVLAEIGREIPVVPAVVAAEGNLVLA